MAGFESCHIIENMTGFMSCVRWRSSWCTCEAKSMRRVPWRNTVETYWFAIERGSRIIRLRFITIKPHRLSIIYNTLCYIYSYILTRYGTKYDTLDLKISLLSDDIFVVLWISIVFVPRFRERFTSLLLDRVETEVTMSLDICMLAAYKNMTRLKSHRKTICLFQH